MGAMRHQDLRIQAYQDSRHQNKPDRHGRLRHGCNHSGSAARDAVFDDVQRIEILHGSSIYPLEKFSNGNGDK